jgi:hypothetical protein
VFFKEERFEGHFFRSLAFRGALSAIEGRRKVHFHFSPSSVFLKFLSFFSKVFRKTFSFGFSKNRLLFLGLHRLFRGWPRLRTAQSANPPASGKRDFLLFLTWIKNYWKPYGYVEKFFDHLS